MATDSSSTSASVKKTEKIWLDGKFLRWEDTNVHIMTHALHYGLGVFEGIRAYKTFDGKTAIFRLKEHITRLYESAHILLMEIPFSRESVMEACSEIYRINKMELGYLRPIAFSGDGAMGLGAINPTRLAIALWDWGAYLGDEGLKNGIRAKVSSFTRNHVNVSMVRGKITGQYVNSILAKREAKLAGYDEAILLDAQGFVAEASGENIFMVKGNTVFTPPLSSPILAGVTRDSVIRLLKDKGYEVKETTFTRDSLYIADEVFFTGTAAEITPVREVDNRKVGAGTAGPVTKVIQDTYFKVVRGEDGKYKEWLTYV